MRIAYLDCFSGISGDMFLGALLDAGVAAQVFEKTVAALNVGARLEISRVNRSGISATKIDVLVHGEKELPREVYWEQKEHKHEHGHKHDHGHSRAGAPAQSRAGMSAPHEHGRGHSRAGAPAQSRAGMSAPHEHGRGLREIKEIISRAAISEGAKKTSLAIFQALGEAEAKIHNTDIEKIHFHEVGAVDAM